MTSRCPKPGLLQSHPRGPGGSLSKETYGQATDECAVLPMSGSRGAGPYHPSQGPIPLWPKRSADDRQKRRNSYAAPHELPIRSKRSLAPGGVSKERDQQTHDGSAHRQPSPTLAAPRSMARLVDPSVRACRPSATRAALPIRRPMRMRYCATNSFREGGSRCSLVLARGRADPCRNARTAIPHGRDRSLSASTLREVLGGSRSKGGRAS